MNKLGIIECNNQGQRKQQKQQQYLPTTTTATATTFATAEAIENGAIQTIKGSNDTHRAPAPWTRCQSPPTSQRWADSSSGFTQTMAFGVRPAHQPSKLALVSFSHALTCTQRGTEVITFGFEDQHISPCPLSPCHRSRGGSC